jgi:hypothetical protein
MSLPTTSRALSLVATIALGCQLGACSGEIENRPGFAPPGAREQAGSAAEMSPVSSAGSNAGMAGTGTAGSAVGAPMACTGDAALAPGRAPLRRLTRFEFNNTVRDVLGDDSSPANALPSEELGNGFGNDADAQSVSSLLAEQYSAVAEDIATRTTDAPALLAKHAPCAASITATSSASDESACASAFITSFAPRAYRRPLEPGEAEELLALQQALREGATFSSSLAAVIEAVLQSPEFLYRLEWGVPVPGRNDVLRPSGHEMAARLSYLLWGTAPDEGLRALGEGDALLSDAGVLAQATAMLDDPRARQMVRFFFDNLLPISGLSGLERDRTLFPTFTPAIGGLMREETQRFLEYEIFEGPGSWRSALSAPYTFVNGPLAEFYGISGVTGSAFQKVAVDPARRLGLLTQAGMLAGTTHSNTTSPVLRGSYVVRKLLCLNIPLPTAELLGEEVFAMIKPPEPYTGKTARERYSAHSENPVCASCHRNMDPVGLALENYDPVGLWRDQENGVTIDASGGVPGDTATVSGPVELARKIAETEEVQSCFASHWSDFAYARTLDDTSGDACTLETIAMRFEQSGYDVRALLLALTQTPAFLYLPAVRE